MKCGSQNIKLHDNPIKLHFMYGPETDVKRVKNTLKKISWFKENGYRPILPEGILENSSLDEIREVVVVSYDEKPYETLSQEVLEIWDTHAGSFIKLKAIPDCRFHDTYEVVLTKYGVGGSYYADTGKIIVNINTKKVIDTIQHEIIHTGIEYLIQKYKVSHWRKERLVGLICKKYFDIPARDITEDVSDVDEAFIQLWPNVEEITRRIGEKACS